MERTDHHTGDTNSEDETVRFNFRGNGRMAPLERQCSTGSRSWSLYNLDTHNTGSATPRSAAKEQPHPSIPCTRGAAERQYLMGQCTRPEATNILLHKNWQLPFPVIGALNGVHMFAGSHDVKLLSTTTHDAKVIWKVFHDSITLILVSQDDDSHDCHMTQLLNLIFDAMVLLYGQDDIISIKNIERFKREIRVSFRLIDELLGHDQLPVIGDVTDAIDVIIAPENDVLQSYLDAFVEASGSAYGCLYIQGRVVVATKKWWSLSSSELILLSFLLRSLTKCTSRDIPVFLPNISPTVPHRLLTFQLFLDVEVCVICGSTPSLPDLEPEVMRYWGTAYDTLQTVNTLPPRNFPTNIVLDRNILGFILVNTETHQCLYSTEPEEEENRHLAKSYTTSRRQELLLSFYRSTIGSYFASTVPSSKEGPSRYSHKALDTYSTAEDHKCYAFQSNVYQLFVLFMPDIPTFAMRSVVQKTLLLFTKDKVCHL